MRRINRLYETNINNQGYLMKIVEYQDANHLIVEFQDEHKHREKNKYERFKKGNIPNPYHPTVYGIGYLGNTTCCDKSGKHKISNIVWKDMLCRCYNPKWIKKHPYYKNCSVCSEWLNYSNFEKWFNNNYYIVNNEQMNLDKDILIKGNTEYSPNKCCFVPHKINALLVKSIRKTEKSKSSTLPIGVYISNGYYCTKLFNYENGVLTRTKIFSKNEEEINKLFNMYKESKEKYIKQVADEYKNKIPEKIYYSLYNYTIEKE